MGLENERLSKFTEENIDVNEGLDEYLERIKRRPFTLADLPELLKAVNSSQLEQQYLGVIGIRRLVSKGIVRFFGT